MIKVLGDKRINPKYSGEFIKEVNFKTFLIWTYMDQADVALTDLMELTRSNGHDKQRVKQLLNQIQKLILDYRGELYRKTGFSVETKTSLGEASDEISTMIKMNMYMGLKEELGL